LPRPADPLVSQRCRPEGECLYRAQDGKLVIIDSEAEIVRFIFRRYAELASVRLLKDELEARGIQSPRRC
jgi:hypothetical protein